MNEKTGCVIAVLVCLAISALSGLVLMLLWNWIMPYLFNLPKISYWMALGISLLVSLLFGGLKGRSSTNED